MNKKKEYSVFIVPTGTGASIGGYAGDAGAIVREIAKEIPLIVNPNVVNAACFSSVTDNMLYCEGYSVSEFFAGNISFIPSTNNKIGIIFDKAIPQNVINVHINTINAFKTVFGTEIIGYEITKDEVGVDFFITDEGISSGRVRNPETLIKAGKNLTERGAEALAVVCRFEESDSLNEDYEAGEGIDPVGGAEAIISHYLVKELMVPAAHAPAFDNLEITDKIVSPKAASEYITPTFLPCILTGLTNAPKMHKGINEKFVTINDVKSLIMPYNALGSSIVSNALKRGIKVIAVKENKTVLNADPFNTGLNNVIIIKNDYKDCSEYLKRIHN